MKKVLLFIVLVAVITLGTAAFMMQKRNSDGEKFALQEQLKKTEEEKKRFEQEIINRSYEDAKLEQAKRDEELRMWKLGTPPEKGTLEYSLLEDALLLRVASGDAWVVVSEVSKKVGTKNKLDTFSSSSPYIFFGENAPFSNSLYITGAISTKNLNVVSSTDHNTWLVAYSETGDGSWLSPDKTKIAEERNGSVFIFDLLTATTTNSVSFSKDLSLVALREGPAHMDGYGGNYGTVTKWISNNEFQFALYRTKENFYDNSKPKPVVSLPEPQKILTLKVK